jgi:ElaB protein
VEVKSAWNKAGVSKEECVMNTATHSNEKIAEALKLLNEAAQEKKSDLAGMIADKYETLKQVIVDSEKSMGHAFARGEKRAVEAAMQAKEFGIKKAKEVDERVHDNPWPYIGGAALVGILVGYILGRKNNR